MHLRFYWFIQACQGVDCLTIFSCNILHLHVCNGVKTPKVYAIYLFIFLFIHHIIFQEVIYKCI